MVVNVVAHHLAPTAKALRQQEYKAYDSALLPHLQRKEGFASILQVAEAGAIQQHELSRLNCHEVGCSHTSVRIELLSPTPGYATKNTTASLSMLI